MPYKDPEKKKEWRKKYYQENKSREKQLMKKYKENNKEKIIKYNVTKIVLFFSFVFSKEIK